MKLSLEEVEKIATLARLELTEEEKSAFQKQLSSILAYVEKLQAVETSDVEPLSHVAALGNVLREDEAHPSDEAVRKALIDAFPEKENDLLRVKAVFS